MVDYNELMGILSIPRPNGSKASRDVISAIKAWLSTHQIPFRVETYSLYPYFFECIGLWILVSRTLLALAIWLRWEGVSLVHNHETLSGMRR